MSANATILFPPAELASCISLAIVRDTRDADLCEADRQNYFPASPLVALTVVMEGHLRVSTEICDVETMRTKQVMPKISVTPPQATPTQSWSDGPIHALTVGFYTDAWTQLGGHISTGTLPPCLERAALQLLSADGIEPAWDVFCATLGPIWVNARAASSAPDWAGSHKISDWTRFLLTRAALSGAGQGARSLERRIKRLTGQSGQSLKAYAKMEDLLDLRIREPDAPLAGIATDARFSDQSHMGRAVKKATGFSPGRLNRLIEIEEAFWCYRLLGERL
ncbi:MAG: helix-turn-helix domain-containing protein [Sulfitobacter sp.]